MNRAFGIIDPKTQPGVIVVSPGWGLPAAMLTGLVTDLASRGFAVVTIDHTHDSAQPAEVSETPAFASTTDRPGAWGVRPVLRFPGAVP
jgi:hypothetical protein